MNLELSPSQAADLAALLTATLGDLSYEIAATETPQYRQELVAKRNRLVDVAQRLGPH